MKKILFAGALLFSIGSFAQTAKLVLNKGQKFEVTTTLKTTSVSEMMGQEMETNIDNITIETFEVKETRENETDLVGTVTRVKANMSMMGQDMEFDSDDKNNSGPLAEGLSDVVGKTRNISVDATGKITKEDKPDAAASAGMMAGISAGSGIALFRSALINKPLEVNSTWADSSVSDADKMKTVMVGNYKVIAVDGDIASIQYDGNQEINGTMEQMGQEMGMSSKNKVSTTIKMSLTSGLITEVNTTSDGTSTVEAMGMSIPGTVKTTSKIVVKAL